VPLAPHQKIESFGGRMVENLAREALPTSISMSFQGTPKQKWESTQKKTGDSIAIFSLVKQ
jgi:hypothetical protein